MRAAEIELTYEWLMCLCACICNRNLSLILFVELFHIVQSNDLRLFKAGSVDSGSRNFKKDNN